MRPENAEVVAWPKIVAVLDGEGGAEVTINGAGQTLRAGDVDAARNAVIDLVADATAAALERPVKLEVTDPDGHWQLLVHPDGEVEALAEQPAPRPRVRALRVRRAVLASGVGALMLGCVGAVVLSRDQGGERRVVASRAVKPQPPAAPSAHPEALKPPSASQPDRIAGPPRPKAARQRRASPTRRSPPRARRSHAHKKRRAPDMPRRKPAPQRTPGPAAVTPPRATPSVQPRPSDEFGP
jgi:hypothetical protein